MRAAMARLAAAVIALIAWAGLAIQFGATHATGLSAPETLWVLLRFFTIVTNLLVAATMSAIALGRMPSPAWIGGLTLAILLVGIVYLTLLRGLVALSGAGLLADRLLHYVTPVLLPLWWLTYAPKGLLGWRDPLIWALYPLAYFLYAIVRGLADGKYPYPFIDVAELGWTSVIVNAVLIAAGFMLAGLGLVALDRRLGRRNAGS